MATILCKCTLMACVSSAMFLHVARADETRKSEPSSRNTPDDFESVTNSRDINAAGASRKSREVDCDCRKQSADERTHKDADDKIWQNRSEIQRPAYNGTRSENDTHDRSIPEHDAQRLTNISDWEVDSDNETLRRSETRDHAEHARKPMCNCSKDSQLNMLATQAKDVNTRSESHGCKGRAENAQQPKKSGRFLQEKKANEDCEEDGGLSVAALIGLAGAGAVALCIMMSLVLICRKRSGKRPTNHNLRAVDEKVVKNVPSDTPGVVVGVAVTSV